MTRPIVDGQRPPRAPAVRLELLDDVGLDRRMTPGPLVFEHSGFADFVAAGGWVPTQPGELVDVTVQGAA